MLLTRGKQQRQIAPEPDWGALMLPGQSLILPLSTDWRVAPVPSKQATRKVAPVVEQQIQQG